LLHDDEGEEAAGEPETPEAVSEFEASDEAEGEETPGE